VTYVQRKGETDMWGLHWWISCGPLAPAPAQLLHVKREWNNSLTSRSNFQKPYQITTLKLHDFLPKFSWRLAPFSVLVDLLIVSTIIIS